MNETITTIYQRRSIRSYLDKKVPASIVGEIISAGKMAPSAVNTQPWNFYVADDPALISRLSIEIAAAAEQYAYLAHGVHLSQPADRIFFGAQVVVFLSAPRGNEWAQLDIGMCTQNMMLAAASLGLASCPIGFGKFLEKTKSYTSLSIPDSEEIIIAVTIGYTNHIPAIEDRRLNNVFYLS